MKDRLIDIHEFAEYLGVSTRCIRYWLAEGRLPMPLKINRTLRWREPDIERFVHDNIACLSAAKPVPSSVAGRHGGCDEKNEEEPSHGR